MFNFWLLGDVDLFVYTAIEINLLLLLLFFFRIMVTINDFSIWQLLGNTWQRLSVNVDKSSQSVT